MARKKTESLGEMLKREQDKLVKLTEKRDELEAEIKTTRANIRRLQTLSDAKQFATFSNALDKAGVSMEDILFAVANGDFLTLQEKLDAKANAVESE